jgi:hypothetical protein
VEPALAATRFPAGVAWALPVLAAVVGMLTDALGPERRVNILSVPLLGLILWNLAAYVALAALALVRRARRPAPGSAAPPGETGAGWGRALAAWTEWRVRRQARADATETSVARDAVAVYLARWRRLAGPLLVARGRSLLHAGAALLALGVLAGAYGRGIAFEYQATWESTFLDARALRAVLVVLLGPASALLGGPIPASEALAAMRAPAAGDAAPWVHRYALTVLLAVVLPRTLLAGAAWIRVRRLAADVPVDLRAPYFLRLTAGTRPLARVEVLPYGGALVPGAEERLRRLLHDLVGTAADVRIAPAAPYGAEPDEVLTPDTGGGPADVETWRVIVFSLAQSPENEVHGALLSSLVAWVGGDRPGRRRAVAVLDAASYRNLLTGTGVEVERLTDRRRAWDQMARATGATLVHLDLDDAMGDEPALARLERGVWPSPGRLSA